MPNCIRPLHRLERCEFHFVQYKQKQQDGLHEEIDAEFEAQKNIFACLGRRGKAAGTTRHSWGRHSAPSLDKRFIYFILTESLPRYVKIGTSVDPAKRLYTLQTASPFNLRMLGFIEGSNYYEGATHALLVKYKVRGEWFKYEGLVKEVCAKIESGYIEDTTSLMRALREQ